MRRQLLSLFAIVLSAAAAIAQMPAKQPMARYTCPATVDVTYTQVSKLDFGMPDPKLEIKGWQPRFKPATVRLIQAEIDSGADEKHEIMSNMPDNGDTAKPGEPLVYTVWAKDQKTPAFPAYVMCQYEGGFAMQQALPATTRVCTLKQATRKAAPAETSARDFITSAEFLCQ